MGTTCSRHQLGTPGHLGGEPWAPSSHGQPSPGCASHDRCHKTAVFTDTRESSIVFQPKCSVQGILKQPLDDQLLDNSKTLGEVWLHQPDSTAAVPSGRGASLPGSWCPWGPEHWALLQPAPAARCDEATGLRKQRQWTSCAVSGLPRCPLSPSKRDLDVCPVAASFCAPSLGWGPLQPTPQAYQAGLLDKPSGSSYPSGQPSEWSPPSRLVPS